MPGKKHNGGPLLASASGLYGSTPDTSQQAAYGSRVTNGNGKHSGKNNAMGPQPESSLPAVGNGSTGGHVYTADHLVTWSVGPKHGVLTHEDGIRQLSLMEEQTGVFTMRCTLTVAEKSVDIIDGQSGEIMEQFPLDCVRDPVAVRDRNGMFNNIVLFTVVEDSKNKQSPSEMHIFQVVNRSAMELADDIVDMIAQLHSKTKKSTKNQPAHAEPYELQAPAGPNASRPREQQIKVRKIVDGEDLEEDVQNGVTLMNKCFDDIERFVLRLKQCKQAVAELGSRKQSRRKHGDGMLTMRSRAPAPGEFMEVLQKFKLTLNVLARLRSYLHNPNAAELVHFLFTPLGLVVEASKDPRHDLGDLVGKVVSPLLTKHAVDLLSNCLSSKEFDFWMSFGEAWRTPRNKWNHGHVVPYRPKFNDGWQPPESWLDIFLGNSIASAAANQAKRQSDVEPEAYARRNGTNLSELIAPTQRQLSEPRSPDPLPPVAPSTYQSSPRPDLTQYQAPSKPPDRRTEPLTVGTPWDDFQKTYLRDLVVRGAKIYEVLQDRKGNNNKELTIRKGEMLEVLDDTRNWWKCSNSSGDQGFVPYTLLKRYEEGDGNPVADYAAQQMPLPPPPPALVLPSPLSTNESEIRKLGYKGLPPQDKKKSDSKKEKGNNNNNSNSDFSSELRQRLSHISRTDSQKALIPKPATLAHVFIDHHSTADEVSEWLRRKGFQEYTQSVLRGYSGIDLFTLHTDALLAEFGQNEGGRLVSQLKLMKTSAGYSVSGSSELKKILERRKSKADDAAVDYLHSPSSNGSTGNGNPRSSSESDDESTNHGSLKEQLRNKKKEMIRKF